VNYTVHKEQFTHGNQLYWSKVTVLWIYSCALSAVHTSCSLKLQLISKPKKNTGRQLIPKKKCKPQNKTCVTLESMEGTWQKKRRSKITPMNWRNKRNIAKQTQARKKGTDPGQCENWCVIADGDCILQNSVAMGYWGLEPNYFHRMAIWPED